MSRFVKDLDAHTRGVNAIAASDAVGTQLRRREQIKAARMHRRDRVLAQLAGDAYNPMKQAYMALGRVNLTGTRPPGSAGAGDLKRNPSLVPKMYTGYGGGAGGGGGGTPRPPLDNPPRQPTTNRAPNSWLSTGPSSRTPAGSLFRPPQRPLPQPDGIGPPSGHQAPDVLNPYPTNPGAGSGSGSGSDSSSGSSGSSGGGSSGGGSDYAVMPTTDDQALDSLVSSPDVIVDASTSTIAGIKTNWLLIAGLAAGAYFLLRNKD